MLSVSEKHKFRDSKAVCACVTMWKFTCPLESITWLITFWYIYHQARVKPNSNSFKLVLTTL